jgi:hypothetical protein
MHNETIDRLFDRLRAWSYRYRSALVIVVSLGLILLLIHWLGWWETLGILFLKFGLGAKVAGAKSFTHAIIKAGGKKAIATATAGMLAKRHIIDLISKFFAEHSVRRYKRNLILVLSGKYDEIRHSTLAKKIKAFGSMLLSVPILYFFWTKVLGTAIQKFVYALLLPLLTLLWRLIVSSVNFLGFVFEILMLNLLLDALKNYRWGKWLLSLVDYAIYLTGRLLNLLNTLLGFIGLDPKGWLVKFSIRFNRWLESILDKGLSKLMHLEKHRDRYVNAVEALSEKRHLYRMAKQEKRISYWRTTQKLFKQKVLKEKDWREKRAERAKRWDKKRKRSRTSSYTIIEERRRKRSALLLPYHRTTARRIGRSSTYASP